jgi:hypothetical protein
MSVLIARAETTTDNLLNNPNFTTDTSGWELSDNNQDKVKRDPATYSGSASKSVRFRYQGGNISQDVDISGVSENHLIKEINMNFDSIGCGNTGSQWCNAGADDTVVSTITLSTEFTSEVLSETTAVPYEDGWESYSFTKDVIGDFNTDDASLNLTITGNDTGNSSNWYGPIIDNLSLSLTIEEYVAPVVVEPIVVQPIIEPLVVEPIVVEPIVVEPIVEPIIEPIVIIEETLIEGLTLDTEIVNDVILQPVAIEIPTLPDLPDLPEVSEITPEVPEISMNIEVPEISVDIPEIPVEIPEIEVVEEIQEIEVSEPVVEEIAEVELETPEELKEPNMEEDVKESQNETEQTAESEVEGNENSELSDSSEAEVKSDESKVVKKSKSKDSKDKKKNDAKEQTAKNTPNKTTKTNKPKVVAKVKKPATNADKLGQINITTMVYLQVIPQTITIQETVSLTQENIYEQDIGALASSDAYDSLIGSASSRWVRMVDVRPKHTFSGYGR